jgi:hypothetical protein
MRFLAFLADVILLNVLGAPPVQEREAQRIGHRRLGVNSCFLGMTLSADDGAPAESRQQQNRRGRALLPMIKTWQSCRSSRLAVRTVAHLCVSRSEDRVLGFVP